MLLLELKIVKGLLNALAQIDPCGNLIPITQYWVKILAALAWRLLLIWTLVVCITRYHNRTWCSSCWALIHRSLTTDHWLLAILDSEWRNARDAYFVNLLRYSLHLSYWCRTLQLRLLQLLAQIVRYLLLVDLCSLVVMRSGWYGDLLLSNTDDMGLMLPINDWDSCSFRIRISIWSLIGDWKLRLFLIRGCSSCS